MIAHIEVSNATARLIVHRDVQFIAIKGVSLCSSNKGTNNFIRRRNNSPNKYIPHHLKQLLSSWKYSVERVVLVRRLPS